VYIDDRTSFTGRQFAWSHVLDTDTETAGLIRPAVERSAVPFRTLKWQVNEAGNPAE